MKRLEKNENLMIPMNEIFSGFDLQALEERLETDPLVGTAFLNMDYTDGIELYGHCDSYSCGGMFCDGYDW